MSIFDIANNLKPERREQRRNDISYFSLLMLFMDASLKGYQHPSAHRAHSWDLYKNTPSSLRKKKRIIAFTLRAQNGRISRR